MSLLSPSRQEFESRTGNFLFFLFSKTAKEACPCFHPADKSSSPVQGNFLFSFSRKQQRRHVPAYAQPTRVRVPYRELPFFLFSKTAKEACPCFHPADKSSSPVQGTSFFSFSRKQQRRHVPAFTQPTGVRVPYRELLLFLFSKTAKVACPCFHPADKSSSPVQGTFFFSFSRKQQRRHVPDFERGEPLGTLEHPDGHNRSSPPLCFGKFLFSLSSRPTTSLFTLLPLFLIGQRCQRTTAARRRSLLRSFRFSCLENSKGGMSLLLPSRQEFESRTGNFFFPLFSQCQ